MAVFRRYAIYYAPRPETALGRFGAAWFGRDAETNTETGVERARLALEGLPLPREALVAAPRRYGFHATLKAPFRLAEGRDAAALDAAVAALAAARAPVQARLEVRALGGFLALAPSERAPEIDTLAAVCVTALDGFRAPPTAEETARRRAAGLDAREAALLDRWGYPWVLDRFRFHITLTGPLDETAVAAAGEALAGALAPLLASPVAVEDLCLFGEAEDGSFRVARRHPLAGPG